MRLDEVKIELPIMEAKTSPYYALILTDSLGLNHYFNFDGTYDGYSSDCDCRSKIGFSLN